MPQQSFSEVAAYPASRWWKNRSVWAETLVKRSQPLYSRPGDIRSDFARDYNRILHSTAYRRLKHKTQVFFATGNDHVCTRIEHVTHVAAVSRTIATRLGLNTELTDAIAIGHDLGHAPFGHTGEEILKRLSIRYLRQPFWHERNSLRFVDKLETLPSPEGGEQPMSLTYAVRDGIVCHCGEKDSLSLFPRRQVADLQKVTKSGQLAPYTWEGCVVRLSDQIAFIGRDIEDAERLGLMDSDPGLVAELAELLTMTQALVGNVADIQAVNNTVLMYHFITNLCETSTPEEGIGFSEGFRELMTRVRHFSYQHIYAHPRLKRFHKYAELILTTIFETLDACYDGSATCGRLSETGSPTLTRVFGDWLDKHSDMDTKNTQPSYRMASRDDYRQAIIDFASGMTDTFAIKLFQELTAF